MGSNRWRAKLWLIDGHNTIFALPELCHLQTRGERQAARAALESLLRPFATRLKHPLTIVYDGNQIERNPEAGVVRGIRVLFSQPPTEVADDRIVFLAAQAVSRGEAVTVVTNDQRSLAPRLPAGVHVLGVAEFRDRWLSFPRVADEREEKLIADDQRRQIEQAFLARQGEIMERASRGARRTEREMAARWQARARQVAEPGGPDPALDFDRRADRPPARPASAPDAHQSAMPAPTGRDAPEARAAREARRRRGQRKQARRLEQMRRQKGKHK